MKVIYTPEGLGPSIKDAIEGLKSQWYVVDCPKKNARELNQRWDAARALIDKRTHTLAPFVRGLCVKISEGFDRISILFEKCDPTERESRFELLMKELGMTAEEKFTFKSYSTFMKLHGWEKLEEETKSRTDFDPSKQWLLGRLDEKSNFKHILTLTKILDLTENLGKYKHELNFADLDQSTGNG